MKKSNLVSILQTFEKKETREFKKWLRSPAHNQRQDVIDLFDYLMIGKHLFSSKHLEKEYVFNALFQPKEYNDAEIRQTMHFLFRAVENFLVYGELLKDHVRSHTILAKVYRQRQLPKLFKKTMDAGQKIQEKQPLRNHQYFEHEFALQFEQYTYLSGLGRSVPYNLQKVSDASDNAYLANKLQLSCFMIAHQTVFNADYDMGLLHEVLSYLEKNDAFLEIPAIAIYYFGFKAIKEKEREVYFWKLKEQISKNGDLFPLYELRVIYLLALNYCIGRINEGKTSFYRESFLLYNEGMNKGIFLENGVLSRFTFSNAVIAGLNLEEYEWAENFILKYSKYLEEKHRDNFVRFYMARMHYEKKDYAKAMKLFAQSDYDDILMTLNAKTMLMKMYFELNEYNALDSLLASMGTYLQRKKLMGYHKTNYKNIISSTKKLLKISPYGKDQKEKLKKDFLKTNPLTERKWLLEQLNKL